MINRLKHHRSYWHTLPLILLFLLSLSDGNAQQEFTLNEAVQYAEMNSIQSQLNAIEIADAQQQIKETTAIGIPKINGSFGYNYNYLIPRIVIPSFTEPGMTQELSFGLPHNVSGDITASTLLIDSQYIFGLRAARTYKALVNSQTVTANRDVRYNVAKTYLGAWLIKQHLEIVKFNINNLGSSLKEIKEIHKNGFAEQLDVDRLTLSMRSLETEYENLERMTEVALNNLKFLLNYPMEQDISIDDDFVSMVNLARVENIDIVAPIDISQRPEYTTFRTQEEINSINVKRLKAGNYPNITAFANYQANLSRNKLFEGTEPGFLGGGQVGATLNVPIFDGFARKAQVQRARLNLELVRTRKLQFVSAATMEAKNAKIALYNNQQSLNKREENLELAQKIYDVTKIKYSEGVGSSIETSTAERELYAIQAQLLESQFELLNAKIDLDKAQGKF